MSIKDIAEKIKPYWKEDVFITLSIILIGFAGFGLGRLSALEKGRDPIQIKPANLSATTFSSEKADNSAGLLVASKSGKKYHFPWCAGASQIAEKNKIWFASYEEAQKAGYTPASNCPNLK